jgi:predicted kinase
MKTLILCCGLPQSGKSTWARQQGCPVVNPDSIRLALHGKPFVALAEPFVWAIAKVMVRALFLAGHDTVILDATNTTRSRRDEWKSKDWCRHFQVFGGPEMRDVCIERAKHTAVDAEHEAGLVGAINRMADAFEPITEEETYMP